MLLQLSKPGWGTAQVRVHLELVRPGRGTAQVGMLLELARPKPGPAASWGAREAKAEGLGDTHSGKAASGKRAPSLASARRAGAWQAGLHRRSAARTSLAARQSLSARPPPARARESAGRFRSHASAAAGQRTPAAGWSWTAWPAS